ncbi:hypothetical protein BN1708_020341, partial [Verticillium longisporum]
HCCYRGQGSHHCPVRQGHLC